jgi:hypothetical protein
MTTTMNDDAQASEGNNANANDRNENTKPVTILVPEDTLRRLKVIAIIRDTTVGEMLVDAAAALVRRDLKKVLSRLEV